MRVAFQMESVLERARLALVGVHGHQPRRRLGAHQRPFASGRKARAAKPAQAGIADDFDEFVPRALAVQRRVENAIAAGLDISVEVAPGFSASECAWALASFLTASVLALFTCTWPIGAGRA